MTFTLPNATANLTYVGVMQWANNTTEGTMGYAILLIIFAVIVLGSRRYTGDLAKSIFAGTFVAFMSAGAMTMMGILSTTIFWIVGVLMLFSYIFTSHN